MPREKQNRLNAAMVEAGAKAIRECASQEPEALARAAWVRMEQARAPEERPAPTMPADWLDAGGGVFLRPTIQ